MIGAIRWPVKVLSFQHEYVKVRAIWPQPGGSQSLWAICFAEFGPLRLRLKCYWATRPTRSRSGKRGGPGAPNPGELGQIGRHARFL
jgi:hypothetical protein